jgi:hypothetical protein
LRLKKKKPFVQEIPGVFMRICNTERCIHANGWVIAKDKKNTQMDD